MRFMMRSISEGYTAFDQWQQARLRRVAAAYEVEREARAGRWTARTRRLIGSFNRMQALVQRTRSRSETATAAPTMTPADGWA
jgi:hypothetical protein